ncbi:MAG: WYL domain-containing protein [Clostridia bacterium]|nr:WYL domain-containing protein [Clostridia bacterium]
MIFSELYSAYYKTVAAMITDILHGERSEKELKKVIARHAFGESALTIMPALKNEKWQLVHADMTTPLLHEPTMPLTTLQKRWLKAISLDPRIKLFGVAFPELDDVEPLFTSEDYHVYDKYSNGDPFDDEEYIERFRFLLRAIHEKTPIKVNITNRKGQDMYTKCIPVRMEYSEKDDKFRLITSGCHFMPTINLSKITYCSVYKGEQTIGMALRKPRYDTVTVRITDERNALERFMLHFAHFEKQAEKLDKKHYLVKIKYAYDDQLEMVIRILSFGPMVEVVGPESFKRLIVKKLKQQLNCGLK